MFIVAIKMCLGSLLGVIGVLVPQQEKIHRLLGKYTISKEGHCHELLQEITAVFSHNGQGLGVLIHVKLRIETAGFVERPGGCVYFCQCARFLDTLCGADPVASRQARFRDVHQPGLHLTHYLMSL